MSEIKIQVKDKVASLMEEVKIVCDNTDYEAVFVFDEEWVKHNIKTARFSYGKIVEDVVFEGDRCPIPAIYDSSTLFVGVFAGNLITTSPAIIPCVNSILSKKGLPKPPTQDVYAQIIELLNKYIEQGGSGGVNREEVEQIVKDYLMANPPSEGFSPTVEVTPIENGNRVVITDKNGEHTFDVLNGKDGKDGESASEGVYELIETIENVEETPEIKKETEPDGTAYNFRAVYVRIHANEAGTASNVIASIYSSRQVISQGSFGKASADKWAYAEVTPHFGWWSNIYSSWGYQTTQTSYRGASHTLRHSLSQYPNLTKVIITNCPPNSTVEIWGVRNNENDN